MNVQVNQTRKESVKNTTINGFNVNALLESAAVNTDVPATGYITTTGFDPSNVNLEVILKRDGKIISLYNGNLALIAEYQTILKGRHLWKNGIPLQAKAAGATNIVSRSFFLHLGGHYNLSGEDEIQATCSLNRGAFGTGISSATSQLQIEPNPSIGIEDAVHKINVYSITESVSNDNVSLGDNISRIALVSFEKDWTKGIFTSCSLSSDRLDWTANEQELILRHWDKFPYLLADHLLEATATNAHPLEAPNTFLIHDKDEIDRAKLSISLRSPNVNASENFVIWTSFDSSIETMQKALAMRQKHEEKNVAKLPLTVNA